jgi:hypothetical protein
VDTALRNRLFNDGFGVGIKMELQRHGWEQARKKERGVIETRTWRRSGEHQQQRSEQRHGVTEEGHATILTMFRDFPIKAFSEGEIRWMDVSLKGMGKGARTTGTLRETL